MVMLRSISSCSKSRLEVLPSTLPRRVVVLPSNRRASPKEVLPQPLCPTSATLRISFDSYFFILPSREWN